MSHDLLSPDGQKINPSSAKPAGIQLGDLWIRIAAVSSVKLYDETADGGAFSLHITLATEHLQCITFKTRGPAEQIAALLMGGPILHSEKIDEALIS